MRPMGWDEVAPVCAKNAIPPNCAWSSAIEIHEAKYLCLKCRRYFCEECYDAHVCDV